MIRLNSFMAMIRLILEAKFADDSFIKCYTKQSFEKKENSQPTDYQKLHIRKSSPI